MSNGDTYCLAFNLADDEAHNKSHDGEGDPCHIVVCKWQGSHEGIYTAQGNACGMETCIERWNNGQADSPCIDTMCSSVKLAGQCQQDQYDSQWIEEHQNRNGCGNDGAQTKECNAEGYEGEYGSPENVINSWQQQIEVSCTGGNQPNTGGKAGKNYDAAQDDGTRLAKIGAPFS